MNKVEIKIAHGIYIETAYLRHYIWKFSFPLYRNTERMIPNIPKKFRDLILTKYDKFFLDLIEKKKPLEFTFGYDEDSGVSAIAIVHPKDYFSRKIGEKLVLGRIQRMKGKVKKIIYEHDDEIINGVMVMKLKRDNKKNPIIKEIQYRHKYHPLPVYVDMRVS